jgi:hypothetical protein
LGVAENVSACHSPEVEAPRLGPRIPTLVGVLLAGLLCASPAAADIRGRVFEDVNYGGGAGRTFGASLGVPRPGARVELYDSTGAFLAFQLTDAGGAYDFVALPGTYTVRVVNASVTSSRAGYVAGLLPVQTFRTDFSTGSDDVTDHVGGEVPSLADAGDGTTTLAALTTATTTAQSITTVTISGGPGEPHRDNVNFGFNFDTIVNVNDSGQGSLRQFLLNSNALANAGLAIVGQPAGRDVSVFMISDGLAHAGLRAGIANLLTGGVAVITPVTALPAITDADTSVDGTTQTANVGDTNAVVLGAGGPTGVRVGADGLALSQVAGPEVEIVGSGMNASGLLIQADSSVVRGLAIHGFGNAADQADVRVDAFLGALIENNVLGTSATSFTDPGFLHRSQGGVYSGGGRNGTVRSNLIGFGRVSGVRLAAGATGWTIAGNEIRDSGMDTTNGDGLDINASPMNTFTGNLVTGTSSQGIVLTAAEASGNVFTNNTVTGNGVGIASGLAAQSAGITIRTGVTSTVLDRNVISANYGAGVQVNSGATGTRMTRNSFDLNGTITARNGSVATEQIGIDLNSPGDNVDLGTWPYCTLNDLNDADAGGNDLLNFPVLSSAAVSGGNLRLVGWARPGSVIELFVASPDPTGFGEGTTYSITLTEGGAGTGGIGSSDPYPDTLAGTGTYGPGPVNGVVQGTDTTSWFAFTLPVSSLPGAIGAGTRLTATATLGGDTSEFSGNVTVTIATAVTLMSFEAVPSDGAVDLGWRTGSELQNQGFNLYRGPSAAGPWTRLNPALIPGLGSSPLGQSYSWRDGGLTNGVRYYYRLEDVDTKSVSTFHGPVSAVPAAMSESQTPSADTPKSPESTEGTTTCPAWVWTAYASRSPVDEGAGTACTRHGTPEAVSLDVTHTTTGATVELRTGGFYAVRDASGAVRAFVPGFDFATDAKAAALPLRRVLVDAPVGRSARLASVESLDWTAYPGLAPTALGRAEMVVARDGTVRAKHRALGREEQKGGLRLAPAAHLAGVSFLGEAKAVTVELSPLRFDPARQALRLAGRMRVRIDFAGVEPGESGHGFTGRHPRRAHGTAGGRVKDRGPTASGETLARLYTTARGLHAVTFETLFPTGHRPIAASTLRLQRGGEAVALHVEPQRPSFGPGGVLYFFAPLTAASTDYTGEIAYELVAGTDGVAMPTRSGAASDPAVSGPPVGSVSFETNRMYQAGLVDAPDPWLWDVVLGGYERTKPFTLSGVDPSAPGTLVVDLLGASQSGNDADHHVLAAVNGVEVGEVTFAGKQAWRLTATLPAGLVREGANELTLTNAGDTGVQSLVFLDRFTVEYPRTAAATAGLFEGIWSGDGAASVSVTGVPAVLDVTGAARWLTGFAASGSTVRFQVEAGHRYVVVGREGLLVPRVVWPEPTTLRDTANQADYIVIAPQEFLAAAQPLVERRQSQGLVVKAVSLEEIASAFGGGSPSAAAIRDFLAHAYQSWRRPSPRYALLLGGASQDPRNFTGSSRPSPLPYVLQRTSFLLTASDPALAAVNGEDEVPDVALGRLPAHTVAQAQALVAKVLDWEGSGQGLAGKAVLVADNPDSGGDFDADVDDIVQGYLGGRATQVIKLSELGASTRPAVLDAWNAGSSLVSYVGHGAAAVWASEGIFTSFDAPSLMAQSRQPVLFTLNCLNGYFLAASFDSLGEALVKAEGRGAIASVSPSGLSLDGPAHVLHRELMAEVTSGRHQRLGDAFLAAQQAYARSGEMPELLRVYNLLGDPALSLR